MKDGERGYKNVHGGLNLWNSFRLGWQKTNPCVILVTDLRFVGNRDEPAWVFPQGRIFCTNHWIAPARPVASESCFQAESM